MTVTTLPTGNADALLAAANKAGDAGENIAKAKADALATVAKIGELAADGALSLTDLAIKFASWVANPDHAIGEEDAGTVYDKYVEGYNARMALSKFAKQGDMLPVGEQAKASRSIFKTFGKVAVAKYGATWFEVVATVVGDHNAKLVKGDPRISVYNGIVRCNRGLGDAWEQASKTETDFADWCKRVVTPAQIAAWLVGKPKEAKDDMTVLMQMVKNLESVAGRDGLPLAVRQHMADHIAAMKKTFAKAEAGTLKVKTEVVTADQLKAGLAA